MEKSLTELQFTINGFENFYVDYLKRQNEFLDTYFRRIKNKAVDAITFQEIIIDDSFFIKIIKKIYSDENGAVTYSPFIIVHKYEPAVGEEHAIEHMYAFSSFLSVMGGLPYKIAEVKAYNKGAEVKLSFAPRSDVPAEKKGRFVLNNNSVDIKPLIKAWFENYRQRAFSQIIDIFITALMRSGILRRDIMDFVSLTSALDAIARDKIAAMNNSSQYQQKFEEIVSEIPNPKSRRWLQSYAEVRELRLDSRLNILVDSLKDTLVFPDDNAKNRLITKIMESYRCYTRLNYKTSSTFNDKNVLEVKQLLIYILRICLMQHIGVSGALIKKAMDGDMTYPAFKQNFFELILKKHY